MENEYKHIQLAVNPSEDFTVYVVSLAGSQATLVKEFQQIHHFTIRISTFLNNFIAFSKGSIVIHVLALDAASFLHQFKIYTELSSSLDWCIIYNACLALNHGCI